MRKGRKPRTVLSVFTTVLMSILLSVTAVLAHHANVSAVAECQDDGTYAVTVTLTSWNPGETNGVNNDVRVYRKIGGGAYSEIGNGAFNSGNSYTFDVEDTLAGNVEQPVKYKVVAVPKWGPSEDKGSAGESRETTLEFEDYPCTVPIVVPCGTANIDGLANEWTEVFYIADMYRAGNSSKKVESKLYAMHDNGTLYVRVATVNGATVVQSDSDAYVKVIELGSSTQVSGASGNDGTAPDFEWLSDGYEASLVLANGIWTINVHLEVFDDSSNQTSAVEDRALKVELVECPDPDPGTITIVKTVVGGDKTPEDFSFFIGSKPAVHNTPVEVDPNQEYQLYEQTDEDYTAGLWGQDCSADGKVLVGEGENKVCTITNTAKPTTEDITACKFEDLNGDGIKDENEPLLSGWTIIWTKGTESEDDDVTKVTGENGCVVFTLEYGTHELCEEQQDGWTNTTNICQSAESTPKPPENVYFGNKRIPSVGSIKACKYHDANKSDTREENESWLSGVTMNLYLKGEGNILDTKITDEDGCTTFEDLEIEDYTVCEIVPEGWQATGPVCRDATIVGDGTEQEPEVVTLKFGNTKPPTALEPVQQPGENGRFGAYIPFGAK